MDGLEICCETGGQDRAELVDEEEEFEAFLVWRKKMISSSSNYMDKKVTEPSTSRTPSFFDDDDDDDYDDDDEGEDLENEEHHHSFSFHPIRPHTHSSCLSDFPMRGWSSLDHIASPKFSGEIAGISTEGVLISEIDRKVKKHVDVLLHSVECLSARVSQMESRTRQVETAFDDLKEAIEFSQGKTDGKLRDLDNLLTQVQSGIQDLRDKQEITEAQLRLAKLKMSKCNHQSEKLNNNLEGNPGKEASVCQQSHQSLPAFAQQPLLNHPPIVPAATAPQLPTSAPTQLPIQIPQNILPSVQQQVSYQPLPVISPEKVQQQYHVPHVQQSQSLPHTSHVPYQQPPHLPLSGQLPMLTGVNPPSFAANSQGHYPVSHHPEEVSYMPYSIHKSFHPPSSSIPSQEINMASAQLTHSKHNLDAVSAGFPAQGLQPQRHANNPGFYHYGASPSRNDGLDMKFSQPLPSPPKQGVSSDYSRLPTARILPKAIPTASAIDDGKDGGGSGNRVPVEDVIDKVVAMGFRRDLVRATVKKLTENGKSVDLNVVLDKLMNNG